MGHSLGGSGATLMAAEIASSAAAGGTDAISKVVAAEPMIVYSQYTQQPAVAVGL